MDVISRIMGNNKLTIDLSQAEINKITDAAWQLMGDDDERASYEDQWKSNVADLVPVMVLAGVAPPPSLECDDFIFRVWHKCVET